MERKFSLFKLLFFLSIVIILPSLFILLNAFEDKQDIRSQAGSKRMLQSQKIIFLEFDFEEDEEGDKMLRFDRPEIRNGYVTNEILGTRAIFTAMSLTAGQLPQASVRFSLPEFVAIDGLDAVSGREHGEMKEVKSDEYAVSLPYTDETKFVKIENVRGEIIALFSIENAQHINNLVSPSSKSGFDYENEMREKIRNDAKDARNGMQDTDLRKEEKENKKENRRNLLDSIFTKVLAANGSFNIAVIGDNYGGDNVRFQSDVNDLARGLISIEPFASKKDNIVFYPQLANTPICQQVAGWPSINCNDSIALQEASTIPYDKIYVMYNGNYTGYAYIGGVLSYGTSSLDQNLAVKQGLFLHEMAGHSLGGLMDEYSYGAAGLSYAPNCSESNSCPSWSGITGLGCFNTCGYTNLYRATDNSSVMNTSYFRGQLDFDSFSTRIVEGKLSEYLTVEIPSPSATITPTLFPSLSPSPLPSVTPSPTVTIALTPTPVPTITELPRIYTETTLFTEPSFTPSPTITPTVTLTPTSTPTLTLTPTPTLTVTPSITLTVIPTVTLVATDSTSTVNCSVPNYCTAVKYCGEDLRTEGSCAGSERVCCKPKTKFEEKKTDTFNIQGNLPTPTSSQRFVPLPTVSLPTPTPEKLILPTYQADRMYVEATAIPFPTITQIPSGSITTNPSPTVSYLASQNLQQTKVIPSPARITDVWPTGELLPTSTNVDDLDFERVTPTPIPEPSAGSILQASVSFIATLFKTVLSLLIGQ